MRKSARSCEAAFTLIELLVVVAIIALLISILLPALQRAKEQGRIAVCASNARAICQAGAAYRMEFSDFPWVLPSGYQTNGTAYSFSILTEFIWGGGMPDKVNTQWVYGGFSPAGPANSANGTGGTDVYKLPPRFRPMNPYLYPNPFENPSRDKNPNRWKLPMNDLPGLFVCPSDKTPFVPELGDADPATEPETPASTWEFWGTSYAINWYWAYYYNDGAGMTAEEGKLSAYNAPIKVLGASGANGPPGLGKRMLNRNNTAGWDSRFLLFMENRLNEALESARPELLGSNPEAKSYSGWHGKKDQHLAGYLDGHAEIRTFDTRYVRGTGWTSWPNTPWFDSWAPFDGIGD